jgi:acyl carrier protein
MIPSVWMRLESLPLTPNGKTDRKALPVADGSAAIAQQYVAPRTEIETKLVEIWQELLGVERVGIEDNFFELGGHSLMVIKMISDIKKTFFLSIPISALFQFTTITELANYIELELNAENDDDKEDKDLIPEEDRTSYEIMNL